MNRIKILGERNTGTNYLAALLLKNTNFKHLSGTTPSYSWCKYEWFENLFFAISQPLFLGWKHQLVNPQKIQKYKYIEDTLVLTLTKNPYSFLLSLYKRPYHYKGVNPETFQDFLQQPWKTQHREEYNNSFESPIALWNQKNQAYIKLKQLLPENTLTMSYESLIEKPKSIICEIRNISNMPQSDKFQNLIEATKGDNKKYDEYKKYYLDEQWRKQLTQENIDFINEQLNQEVMNYFGYAKIERL